MWRSPVSVHGWGPCGRRFKSCHPDEPIDRKYQNTVNCMIISVFILYDFIEFPLKSIGRLPIQVPKKAPNFSPHW